MTDEPTMADILASIRLITECDEPGTDAARPSSPDIRLATLESAMARLTENQRRLTEQVTAIQARLATAAPGGAAPVPVSYMGAAYMGTEVIDVIAALLDIWRRVEAMTAGTVTYTEDDLRQTLDRLSAMAEFSRHGDPLRPAHEGDLRYIRLRAATLTGAVQALALRLDGPRR